MKFRLGLFLIQDFRFLLARVLLNELKIQQLPYLITHRDH